MLRRIGGAPATDGGVSQAVADEAAALVADD